MATVNEDETAKEQRYGVFEKYLKTINFEGLRTSTPELKSFFGIFEKNISDSDPIIKKFSKPYTDCKTSLFNIHSLGKCHIHAIYIKTLYTRIIQKINYSKNLDDYPLVNKSDADFSIEILINILSDAKIDNPSPGHVSLKFNPDDSQYEPNESKILKNWTRGEYLSPDKFYSWGESVLEKTKSSIKKNSSNNEQFNFDIVTLKCRPSFRIEVKQGKAATKLRIDLIFALESAKIPSGALKNKFNAKKCQFFPRASSEETYKDLWLYSLALEKNSPLSDHALFVYNLVTSFCQTSSLIALSNYCIKMLILSEIDERPKKYFKRNIGYLFVNTLHKLKETMDSKTIAFYWENSLNLLENMTTAQFENNRSKIIAGLTTIDKLWNENTPEFIKSIIQADERTSQIYQKSSAKASNDEIKPVLNNKIEKEKLPCEKDFYDFFKEFMCKLNEIDPVFKNYNKYQYGTIFEKCTSTGRMPNDFIINIIMSLPEKSIEINRSPSGYITAIFNIDKCDSDLERTKIIKTWLSNEYIVPQNYIGWFKKLLKTFLNSLTMKNEQRILKTAKSTFILSMNNSGKITVQNQKSSVQFNVNMELALEFTNCLRSFSKSKASGRGCLAIPKIFNDPSLQMCWFYKFQDLEKAKFEGKENLLHVLKAMTNFTEESNMSYLSNYCIETLFLWEVDVQGKLFWSKSPNCLFIHMLKKLQDAFQSGKILFYWDNEINLLGLLKDHQIKDGSNRIQSKLSSIKEFPAKVSSNTVVNLNIKDSTKIQVEVNKNKSKPEIKVESIENSNKMHQYLQKISTKCIWPTDDKIKIYKGTFEDFLKKFTAKIFENDNSLLEKDLNEHAECPLSRGGTFKEFELILTVRFPGAKIKMPKRGFVSIQISDRDYDSNASVKKWLDKENIINPQNFTNWGQSVMSKTFNSLKKSSSHADKITIDDKYIINVNTYLPPFTVSVEKVGSPIRFTLNVVFALKCKGWKFRTYEFNNDADWLAFPTKNVEDIGNKLWHYSFPQEERFDLSQDKNVIIALNLLKMLCKRNCFRYLSENHIKNLFLLELRSSESNSFRKESLGVIFKRMLEKLERAFKDLTIPFIWDKEFNLMRTLKEQKINTSNDLVKFKTVLDSLESFCNNTKQDDFRKLFLTEVELSDFDTETDTYPKKNMEKQVSVLNEDDEKIRRYKPLTQYLNDINLKFNTPPQEISKKYTKSYNDFLNTFRKLLYDSDEIIGAYKQFHHAGSVTDKLSIGTTIKEFDVDISIQIPEEIVDIQSERSGFVTIKLSIPDNLDQSKKKIYNSWLDGENFIMPENFLRWGQSVLSKCLNKLVQRDSKRILDDSFLLEMRKSGPAFTFNVTVIEDESINFDVDIVFSLEFPDWPLENHKIKIRNWLAIPKSPKPDNKDSPGINRNWRYSFTEAEKGILRGTGNCRHVIRSIKRLRDIHNLNGLSSYYIKTVLLWEIDKRKPQFWKLNLGYVFMTVLKELHQMLKNEYIPFYWDENENLLSKLNKNQLKQYGDTVGRIIENIESWYNTESPNINTIFLTKNELNSEATP